MAKEKNNVQDAMVFIQSTLNAPKGQRNEFGKYNYRSCEDVLEAVKPLLKETGSTLTISDEIVQVSDRIYVKATAELITSDGKTYITTAFAREAVSKKGMDESQITGAASSYARKYALGGLFCIDDNKDADALNTNKEFTQPQTHTQPQTNTQPTQPKIKQEQLFADPLEEAFNIVKPEIASATNREALTEIYNNTPELKNYKPFRDALKERSEKFNQ